MLCPRQQYSNNWNKFSSPLLSGASWCTVRLAKMNLVPHPRELCFGGYRQRCSDRAGTSKIRASNCSLDPKDNPLCAQKCLLLFKRCLILLIPIPRYAMLAIFNLFDRFKVSSSVCENSLTVVKTVTHTLYYHRVQSQGMLSIYADNFRCNLATRSLNLIVLTDSGYPLMDRCLNLVPGYKRHR